MEYSSYKIKTSYREESLNLHVIYRLLSSSVIVFCDELLGIVEQEINDKCNTLYIEDFNIQMDNPHHLDSIIFHDFFKSFNLTNLITEATHKSQHTLNLIITDKSSDIAFKPELDRMLSDHSFIHCNLNMAKPMRNGALITKSQLKKVDQPSLKENLQVVCYHGVTPDLHEVVTKCNTNLARILGPMLHWSKECRSFHNQLLFNDRIKDERKIRRVKEWKFREDPNAYNYQAFYNQRHYVSNYISITTNLFKIKVHGA